MLAGTLYKPDGGGPHPILLVLHAATGELRSYPFYQHLYQQLPLHGIAVFLNTTGAARANQEVILKRLALESWRRMQSPC